MKTKVTEITKDPRGFIELKLLNTNEVFDLAEAKLQFDTVQRITEGKLYKLLVDTTDSNVSPTKEAQAFILAIENRIAEALIVKSLAYKILARFYMKSSKNNPTRIFTSRKKAIDWLNSFDED